MDVAILHPAVPPDASPEDQDTLVQVRVIAEALEHLGHRAESIGCTLDLAAARQDILRARPDAVFNLAESLGGADSLQHVPPALLDTLGIPYTGNPTEAIFQTTHKLLAKHLLALAGLPTPAWQAANSRQLSVVSCQLLQPETTDHGQRTTGLESPIPNPQSLALAPPCILKAVWEHASRGLDDANVIRQGDARLVRQRLEEYANRLARPCFAERFIEGREFNLAILEGPDGPEVLPPAEIDFSAFPPDKPRIVGHRAKWIAGTFEFENTPRTFSFPDGDRPLLNRLEELALACWRLFGLRGYARVDFRVDLQGRPWILEINTNPCLAPDAGFTAALARAGIDFPHAIRRILEAAGVRD
ncbi:MAG: hypothetical protein ABR915_18155 [Thermoguttaceae bacterium]|jgi:D-alanine-D-alanine ligase